MEEPLVGDGTIVLVRVCAQRAGINSGASVFVWTGVLRYPCSGFATNRPEGFLIHAAFGHLSELPKRIPICVEISISFNKMLQDCNNLITN